MQKGQIALGVGAFILVLALYFGGKTVVKSQKTTAVPMQQGISFEQYEQAQIAKLLTAEKTQINDIKTALNAVPAADTAQLKKVYLQLSDFWKNLNNPALASFYIYQISNTDKSKSAMENAGDALVSAYKSTEDSVILNNLITFALRSYEEAVRQDSSDIELSIKLADAYVQGSQEPMKGIGILKTLEGKNPDNISVLLALSRLSIQSGQLDKAKERLKKVVQLDPQNTEALYFLAITEAQLGHTEEAIRLFELCKLIVNNKEFSKEIDEIVRNLKSKKV